MKLLARKSKDFYFAYGIMGDMDGDAENSDWSDPRDYDSYRDGGLSRNDPYRNMSSAKDEARPDFLKNPKGVASGERNLGENESTSGVAAKNNQAARDLASVEEGASGETPKNTKDSISGTRENEEAAGGFYSGLGKEKKKKLGRSGGIGFKGFFKKRAPILAIFTTIFGIGGAMFGAQTLLPFAISELIIQNFNSIGISASLVSDAMLDTQLDQGIRQGEPDPSKTDTLFGLSDYQVQQFKINGIDAYNIEAGGTKGAVLLYKKHGGTITVPVVGSAMLGTAEPNEIKKGIKKASGLDSANFSNPVGTRDALGDKDFYVPYMSASKVWRNGTSSWFDKIMKNITEVKLGITRTRWASFAARSIRGADKDLKAEFDKIAAGGAVVDDGVEVRDMEPIYKEETVLDSEGKAVIDSEGKVVTEKVKVGEKEVVLESVEGKSDSKIDSKSMKMSNIENVLTSKAVRAAQGATNLVCGVVSAAVAIYSTVQAYQMLQFLNLVTGFLEAVDRVKAGDGDTSPVMEYTTNLTTAANTVDGKGETITDSNKKAIKRTAIVSAGMSWLFSKKATINSDDPSVKNTNFESIMDRISFDTIGDKALSELVNIGNLTKAMEACGYARIISAGISLLGDAIMLVGTIGTGNIIKFFVKKIATAAVAAAVGVLVTAIVGSAVRQIANLFIKNAATEWFGEDLGNALISGAGKYLGGNGTSRGQGPGTESAVTGYLSAQKDVIAREAEYQRAIRSPFDVTSQYTFLGNLAYSILPLAYSGGSLMSVLTSVANTTSNAIVAMLPTANAIDTESTLSSVGDCPLLEGAGIVGDAYCNPYIVTDVNTTNLAGPEIYNANAIKSDLESDGTIKKNSDLAKYATYCGQRVSQYNTDDASIAAQLQGGEGHFNVGSLLKKVAEGLISDIKTIYDNLKDKINLSWTRGLQCVVGGEYWSKNKYYQRFTETEGLIEGMNPNYTSQLTVFLTDYYKENPLDTSFEGTLARFSGQTKEDVELALNLIEYYDYIDNYDPTMRYAFVESEEEEPIFFEDTTGVPELPSALALEPFKIIYADLRGRYYTV